MRGAYTTFLRADDDQIQVSVIDEQLLRPGGRDGVHHHQRARLRGQAGDDWERIDHARSGFRVHDRNRVVAAGRPERRPR
jgi:hypothetical protein